MSTGRVNMTGCSYVEPAVLIYLNQFYISIKTLFFTIICKGF